MRPESEIRRHLKNLQTVLAMPEPPGACRNIHYLTGVALMRAEVEMMRWVLGDDHNSCARAATSLESETSRCRDEIASN